MVIDNIFMSDGGIGQCGGATRAPEDNEAFRRGKTRLFLKINCIYYGLNKMTKNLEKIQEVIDIFLISENECNREKLTNLLSLLRNYTKKVEGKIDFWELQKELKKLLFISTKKMAGE